MTAKINKDVTEDAEETDTGEAAETPKPAAKKKVRRVRVIEVIDDGDDESDDDLSEVLEALDKADEDDEPAPAAKAPKPAATKVEDEPDPEPDAEPEPALKAGPPKVAAGRTVLGASPVVAGVVIVLIAALATLSIFLWKSQSDLSAKQDTREEINKRITEYGNAVLTLDRNNLQASIDRMQSFLTGDALAGAKKTDVNTLKPSLDKSGVNFLSKTRAVYLGSVDGKFASATLVFDWTIQSATGPQTVAGNYVKLGMVKQGGKWMISKQTPAGRESDGTEGTGVPGLGGTTPNPSQSPSAGTSGKPKK